MPERKDGGRVARVALVIGQLTVGGAEGQLVQVVRRLGPRFEPVVIALNAGDGPIKTRLEEAGVALRTVGGSGPSRARSLAGTLKAERIDLVHAWLFIANAYVLAARLLGVRQPIVTSARNCKVQGRVSQIANALAFRASKAIVVNSADVRAYIEHHYWAPPERVRLVHNGIDTERFHPVGEEGRGPDAPRTIATVGRLVPQKNHDLFLTAAAALHRAVPDVRFVIVGDGPLRVALESKAAELGIGDVVTFTGERHDVDSILRRASLFWLTSRWEGMPNAVLEALASGVPAIATDVGGTRELIRPGQDGFVVTSESAEGFVTQSASLLRDPKRLAAFGCAARERALKFSTERMVAALGDVYEEALGKSS